MAMTPKNNQAFNDAMSYLILNERGFSDHPNDSGGPTKYGITLRTLQAWRNAVHGKAAGTVTAEDVKNLQMDEAKDIYYCWYWQPLNLDSVTDTHFKTIFFDLAVLYGVGNVIVWLQFACTNLGQDIKSDGIVGPKTLGAIYALGGDLVVFAFLSELYALTNRIVAAQPKNKVFMKGWCNRLMRASMHYYGGKRL